MRASMLPRGVDQRSDQFVMSLTFMGDRKEWRTYSANLGD
jgi:hypothetical protein